MIKLVCWNIAAQRKDVWDELFGMDADVALLQEVKPVPTELPPNVELDSADLWEPWDKKLFDRWPTVVRLSNKVKVEWFRRVLPISNVEHDEMAVSGIGTISAARVIPEDESVDAFIAVSMYARWIFPHKLTKTKWSVGYPDGSAHRIMSDLSAFIGHHDPSTHRILVAGDLNLCLGTLMSSPGDLPERTRSVFQRFEDLGLEMVGPQSPNGRKANPTPSMLPPDTKNVPTFALWERPENARLQLDYVFASRGFHKTVHVRALNGLEEWGPSDHCRILIDIS